MGIEVLPHSPSILGTRDRHVLKPMSKNMLGGKKFGSDAEVQSTISLWLGQQPSSCFASTIQKLVDRRDTCLNLNSMLKMKDFFDV